VVFENKKLSGMQDVTKARVAEFNEVFVTIVRKSVHLSSQYLMAIIDLLTQFRKEYILDPDSFLEHRRHLLPASETVTLLSVIEAIVYPSKVSVEGLIIKATNAKHKTIVKFSQTNYTS
jgi:hypothetical protein